MSENAWKKIGPSNAKVRVFDDWCHICGGRGLRYFVEIFYPDNAEHPNPAEVNALPNVKYVRICKPCIDRALA